MIPALDSVLEERGLSEVSLLKSFTVLDINDRTLDSLYNIRNIMSRPLKILNLSILQELRIGGAFIGTVVLPLLNTLFALGSFVNLKELTLSKVMFERTLTLTNLPSLKCLALQECTDGFLSLPLVLADDMRLSTFFWLDFFECRGNDSSVSSGQRFGELAYQAPRSNHGSKYTAVNRAQREFVRAMISHKDTLRDLNIELS